MVYSDFNMQYSLVYRLVTCFVGVVHTSEGTGERGGIGDSGVLLTTFCGDCTYHNKYELNNNILCTD